MTLSFKILYTLYFFKLKNSAYHIIMTKLFYRKFSKFSKSVHLAKSNHAVSKGSFFGKGLLKNEKQLLLFIFFNFHVLKKIPKNY